MAIEKLLSERKQDKAEIETLRRRLAIACIAWYRATTRPMSTAEAYEMYLKIKTRKIQLKKCEANAGTASLSSILIDVDEEESWHAFETAVFLYEVVRDGVDSFKTPGLADISSLSSQLTPRWEGHFGPVAN